MTPEELKEIYDKLADGGKTAVSVSYKSKNPISGGGYDYDDGVEGVDFRYDKHGNKIAIVKSENSPARQQEIRPERESRFKPQKDVGILDNYDSGIFKNKYK